VLSPRGHAIECRVYAEDPDNNFLPSPGRILQLRAPAGPGIRDDSGASAGLEVPIFYGPMISKVAAWAEDRPHALARMRRALGEYLVTGIKTTLPFFSWLLVQPEFAQGRFHTSYLDDLLNARNGRPFAEVVPRMEEIAAIAAAIHATLSPGPAVRSSAASFQSATGRWKAQARVDGLGVNRA
jgi:acetyl-CoA carboxylase biotin carboxylase subunit